MALFVATVELQWRTSVIWASDVAALSMVLLSVVAFPKAIIVSISSFSPTASSPRLFLSTD